MLLSALLAASLALTPGFAQDDEDDDLDFLLEGEQNAKQLAEQQKASASDFSAFDLEEDDDLAGFQVKAEPKPVVDTPFPIKGRQPLADNYPPQVVNRGGATMLELPVLVATDGSGPPKDGWLVVEAWVDGERVGESRQTLGAEAGPRFAFVKLQVPVGPGGGKIRLKVGVADSAGGVAQPLFERSVATGPQ